MSDTFTPEASGKTHTLARTVATRFGRRYVAVCGTSAYVVISRVSETTCDRCTAKAEPAKPTLGPGQTKTVAQRAEHIRLWASIDLERALADGDLQKVADLSRAIAESTATILDTLKRVGVAPSAR